MDTSSDGAYDSLSVGLSVPISKMRVRPVNCKSLSSSVNVFCGSAYLGPTVCSAHDRWCWTTQREPKRHCPSHRGADKIIPEDKANVQETANSIRHYVIMPAISDYIHL